MARKKKANDRLETLVSIVLESYPLVSIVGSPYWASRFLSNHPRKKKKIEKNIYKFTRIIKPETRIEKRFERFISDREDGPRSLLEK